MCRRKNFEAYTKYTPNKFFQWHARNRPERVKVPFRNSRSYTCFFVEQSSQKSLKALLIKNKDLNIAIHSITELLEKASKLNSVFYDLIEKSGKKLDKYYLSTRYPDALPSSSNLIPSRAYTKDEAEEALKISQNIFDLCKKFMVD